MPQEPPNDHTDDFLPLDETLNFNEEDLAANREGRLSERQAMRLRTREAVGGVISNLVLLALVALGVWLATRGALAVGGVLVIIGGGLFFLRRAGQGRYLAEARAGVVIMRRGPLELDTVEYKNPNGIMTEYRLAVDGQIFVVSRDTFIALAEMEAESIAVYYTPTTFILLSAEAI